MNKNYKRMVIICVIFLFIPFIGNSVSQASSIELPFKQELKIPVDTTKARYQPIDMHIFFKHPCWAKNETLHSVRVYYDDGTGLTEIESQIYELEFFDDSHIKACNLVFLIPGEANGKEKYYVLYDDSETPPPNYPDHLIVEDTHYFYEPISGQKMDFDYYKIIEDGYIIYGICQKGVLLGEGVSHTIIKLKPNSTEFETKNADQFASFAMSYAIDGPKQYSGSPRAEVVHKSILVDGNLMIRVRIESTSPEGVIKTSAVYSYYYCPTSMKRIAVHVNHRVLETVEVRGDRERDGTYASLSTFKSRSATIENMNVGNILPSLHVYGEDDTIKEYSIPVNPESHKPEWILSTSDDVDLGSKAWLCIDDPSTGKAHALIFQSNRGLLNGEKDGIQVKSSVRQVVKLPGLEADGGSLFATRNTYEKGGEHDLILPKGMNVTFNAEFVTTEKGDYEVIDRESEIFQKLICYRPITIDNESAEKEKKRYTLTTYVHFAPSFPLGSTLSAVLGKNFSYLYAEVYKEESLTSSGSVGRLPLSENMEFNLKNTSLLQKVKIITDLFDWKNTSLFKKIRFPNLEEGKYLVRVYRENPLFGRERQYIGFGIIDVRENTSLHIFCRSEGKLQTSITNQNGKGIKQVKILLLREETVVAETTTDDNGSAILKAPSLPFRPYKLQVIYQGFLVKEKDLRLGLLRHFLPLKEKFILLLYQLKLQVKDSWGLTPDIDVHPILTSNEMIEPISIKAERKNNGEYIFSNLYPADYTLKISYKSFLIEKRISIDKDDTLKLTFPAEFTVDFDILNVYGMQLNNGKLILIRGGRQIEAEIERSGRAIISVPPGIYEVKVTANGREIAKHYIDVKGNKEVCIVTMQDSLIHIVTTYLGIIVVIFSIIFMIWKRKVELGMKLLAVAFTVIAIVSPWWVLIGEGRGIEMTTKTFLSPPNMITMISTSSIFSGNIGSVPAEFTTLLSSLSIFLTLSVILITLSLIFKKRKTSATLYGVALILLIITIVLFFYIMSQVTNVGVGSFLGNGNLDISLPGIEESTTLSCSWGPGIGFYLNIIAVICLLCFSIYKRKTD